MASGDKSDTPVCEISNSTRLVRPASGSIFSMWLEAMNRVCKFVNSESGSISVTQLLMMLRYSSDFRFASAERSAIWLFEISSCLRLIRLERGEISVSRSLPRYNSSRFVRLDMGKMSAVGST